MEIVVPMDNSRDNVGFAIFFLHKKIVLDQNSKVAQENKCCRFGWPSSSKKSTIPVGLSVFPSIFFFLNLVHGQFHETFQCFKPDFEISVFFYINEGFCGHLLMPIMYRFFY